jgi:septum formation protein
MPIPLLLASASPRRLSLLLALGCDVRAKPAQISEEARPRESPGAYVLRLAEEKARACATGVEGLPASGLVLGADTVVVLDGAVLGKPKDASDARRMLRLLSGREHEVVTGVCLLRLDDGRAARGATVTRVRFRPYDDATIDWYVGTGEPMDKAGAYGIQGKGVMLSDGIEGSWSNVVGLPLECLPGLCREVGLDFLRALLP